MALLLLAGGLFGKARKANQLTGITASVEDAGCFSLCEFITDLGCGLFKSNLGWWWNSEECRKEGGIASGEGARVRGEQVRLAWPQP
jgi:hypothetical protein